MFVPSPLSTLRSTKGYNTHSILPYLLLPRKGARACGTRLGGVLSKLRLVRCSTNVPHGRFARSRKPFGIGADCWRNPGEGPRVRPRTSSRRSGRAFPRAFGAAPCLTDTETPLRGDTEIHGNAPEWLELETWRFPSSHFPWPSVSREAGFRVGWRRCNASLRRGQGRMRACSQIRQRPAERGAARAANRFRGRPQGPKHKLSKLNHSRPHEQGLRYNQPRIILFIL